MPNDKNKTFEYQNDTLVEIEDSRNSSTGKGLIVGAGVLALGVTQSFALTAADFPTATALSDMGLAATALLLLAVFGAGFAFVRKMVH